MSRIRSIKPEFWVSEQIAECSTSARLTFIGMWNFSDDNGVHPAKPKTLKAELYPLDDISSVELAAQVAELIAVGLVAEFEVDGERFWHITGWAKHQKIERPTRKYPVPHATNSTSTRRSLVEVPASTRQTPAPGEEWKGEESKGGEEAASPMAPPATLPVVKGTRLPENWSLPDEFRSFCVAERPELDPEEVAVRFRDHWLAAAGEKARKANWFATWRIWVRSEFAKAATRSTGASTRSSALHADDLIGGHFQ